MDGRFVGGHIAVVKNTFLHVPSDDDGSMGKCIRRSKSAPLLKRSTSTDVPPSFLAPSGILNAIHCKSIYGMVPLSEQSISGSTQSPADESPHGSAQGDSADSTKSEDDDAIHLAADAERTADELGLLTAGSDDDVDTLMIRNIPCGLSHHEVLEAIDELGFKDEYNFFYLPSRRHRENMGYAFIGFPDPNVAQIFAATMTGYRFASRKSLKVVAVVPARIQGKKNLEHFKGTRVSNSKSPPLFFAPCDHTDSASMEVAQAVQGVAVPSASQRKKTKNVWSSRRANAKLSSP